MKRGSLFLIGLLSAIITIASLNYAFGGSWLYHTRYPFHRYYHDCYHRYHDRYNNNDHSNQKQSTSDSSSANY